MAASLLFDANIEQKKKKKEKKMIMLFLNILYISLNVVYREGHNFPPEIGLINVGGYNEQAYIWATF